MGGKALKQIGIETERKSTSDLYRIYSEIKKYLGDLETHLVLFYKNKETHGDLDILIKIDRTNIDLRDIVKNEIKAPFFSNGSVLSFEYDNFQVDFIPVRESNWNVSKCFFDYDPSGNLMGKVAHKFGLKYGFEGLVYPYRTETSHVFADISISKDNYKIFEFLGYSYETFLQGFNSVEEIFDFIIGGKYFNDKIFDYENLNHIDKKRNRKRATYNQFLEYLKTVGITNNFSFNEDKSSYINDINSFFPESDFLTQLNKFKEKEKTFQQIRSKFNGELIMSWYPELKGKELGNVMTNFKEQFQDFDQFCLESSEEKIKTIFVEFYGRKS